MSLAPRQAGDLTQHRDRHAQRAERHRAGAGHPDLVVDLDGVQHAMYGGRRRSRVAGGHGHPQHLAPTGQPGPTAQPQDPVGAGKLEEVDIVVESPRPGDHPART